MIVFFIKFICYSLIWTAVYIGRDKNSDIKLFSKNWWIAVLLVSISTITLMNIL